MFTSNFARAKRFPSDHTPVSIARRAPGYHRGPSYLDLAPTPEMLSMSYDDYVREFDIHLSHLDPVKVMQDLGDKSILLCWESPGVFCHRRCVAQWLESSLGIVIPELGFYRDSYPAYPNMPHKGSPEAKNCLKQLTKMNLINEETQRPPRSPEDEGQPSSLASRLAHS